MRWTARVWGIGFFAAALIGALIVLAPATLIDARLERASDGRLRLAEASGTLWSGAGQIEMRDRMRRSGCKLGVRTGCKPPGSSTRDERRRRNDKKFRRASRQR